MSSAASDPLIMMLQMRSAPPLRRYVPAHAITKGTITDWRYATQVSGTIDCIRIPGESSQAQVLKELREDAIQAACDKGALRATVKIVEMDAIPLQYTSNGAFRAIIKAVSTKLKHLLFQGTKVS